MRKLSVGTGRRTLMLALAIALLSATSAQAFIAIPFPFFTPISECGTVGFVKSAIDDNDCKVWFADSGGAFLVAGIDGFDKGDRVFVDGLICNTCLTTCFAGAILNAVVIPDCPSK